ncbi:ABC transporter permease [Pusillimonas harenae]|uniref:ABC transporter permease n=2 Tax=Pollutimonas harenae TaxID=657015 RepID=A0A853H3Y6_9BURK|nr:ABC transporter permease [Pollutimonas harenae]NYT86932.1 ABC transporter permease [Pollutimonas harenae]TEA69445.1 ABC transporter permease [Pollutimonas harenae]
MNSPARKSIKLDQQTIVFLLFIVIFAIFSVALPGFFSVGNIVAMLRSISVLGILGFAMAIVVIGRGIDLSMVAVMAVPTALIMTLAGAGLGLWPSLILGLLFAVAVGLLNGIFVAYAEIPALFVTLAVGLGLAGLGQVGILKSDMVPWPEQMNALLWLGGTDIAGIPSSIIVVAVVAVCTWLFLSRTKLGLFIYAIGDNPNAARTTGIPVRPIMVFQYVLAALIAVLAGLVMASSNSLMDTRIYNLSLIYDIILVVVLGGVGLSGGRGGVLSVVVGTLLVGTIINGMTIMNLALDMQNLLKGIVLLFAIALDSVLNPRNEETAQQGDI